MASDPGIDMSMAELLDIANTVGLNEDQVAVGWGYAPISTNHQARILNSGAVRVTLHLELPREDVETILLTLRDPFREAGTIGDLIDDVKAMREGGGQ